MKENCGVDQASLERGYTKTGHIPGDCESVFKAETDDGCYCDMCKSESDKGGFLERNNTDDRY